MFLSSIPLERAILLCWFPFRPLFFLFRDINPSYFVTTICYQYHSTLPYLLSKLPNKTKGGVASYDRFPYLSLCLPYRLRWHRNHFPPRVRGSILRIRARSGRMEGRFSRMLWDGFLYIFLFCEIPKRRSRHMIDPPLCPPSTHVSLHFTRWLNPSTSGEIS